MPLAAVAGIGAIGSIAGGIIGSNAAGHAADTQAAAANNAANLERQSAIDALNLNKLQYGNSLALESPFINTADSANGRLAFLMGLNPGQGLPPGVINPNAPPSPSSTLNGAEFDPNALNSFRALRTRGGGRNIPVPNQASSLAIPQFGASVQGTASGASQFNTQFGSGVQNATQLGQSIIDPVTGQRTPLRGGSSFNMNPPITSPGTGGFQMNPPITSPGTGGTQFQMNPPITSGGTTGAAALNGGTGVDVNPFPNGLGNIGGVTNASTNQGGTGQVPQTGGNSLSLNPPINGTGEAMFNPNDPNQGLSPDGSAPSGGTFGSLAQGWNKTFQSPTNVTEQNDPGYQFRLQQGQQALQNSAAARGGLLSGGTAKALTDYNQNAASGEYGNVYNRALQNYNTNYNTFTNDQTNLFNRLMALQSGGQVSANNLSASGITAANNAANIGLTSAGQIGQQLNNAGAATASGYINSANAINGAIGGAANSLSTLALLRQLQGGGAGAGGGGV